MNQTYIPQRDYKVLVRCFTYNQSKYIEDALNGFAMQQTNFPFVCLVMDDCSTDGEQGVIKAWLERECDMDKAENAEIDKSYITIVPHKTNTSCTFAVYFLKQNLYNSKGAKTPMVTLWRDHSEYEAVCEGDDYWTDPLKLQKQVDFLESHEDFSMCFHAASVSIEGVDSSKEFVLCEHIIEKEYFSTELFEKWIVPTASILYRKCAVENYPMKHPEWLTRGDIAIVLKCAHTGRVWGMLDQMSVYRMQPMGVTYNPIYRRAEGFKLPEHFRCIYINFPKVSKTSLRWNISKAYYWRMKNGSRFFERIKDFFCFICWSPKSACKKIKSVLFKYMTNE